MVKYIIITKTMLTNIKLPMNLDKIGFNIIVLL